MGKGDQRAHFREALGSSRKCGAINIGTVTKFVKVRPASHTANMSFGPNIVHGPHTTYCTVTEVLEIKTSVAHGKHVG
jgi:hypothetical protein